MCGAARVVSCRVLCVSCVVSCSDCGPGTKAKCQAMWKPEGEEEEEKSPEPAAAEDDPAAEKELTPEELEAEAAKLQERTIAIKKMIGTRRVRWSCAVVRVSCAVCRVRLLTAVCVVSCRVCRVS